MVEPLWTATPPPPRNGIVKLYNNDSSDLGMVEWITLLTLCFAPVIGHVIAGVPVPVLVSRKKISWADRLCQYNPTTILWRYFAITDRRARARAWNSADMAASNTYFWTSEGWDGSEKMMVSSRVFCTRLPASTRTEAFSASTVQTIIVTLQGIQAIYSLASGLVGKTNFVNTYAIDSIFFPISVFGLLRLFPALWITDDFSYANYGIVWQPPPPRHKGSTSVLMDEEMKTTMMEVEEYPYDPQEFFHPPQYWLARLIRVALMLFIAGLWVMNFAYLIPMIKGMVVTWPATNFLIGLTYIFFLTCTILIFGYYFFFGPTTSTVIPCISSYWYRFYTGSLLGLMVVLLVVSGIETRRLPCGRFTTFPEAQFVDVTLCGGIPINSNISTGLPFGVAYYANANSSNTSVITFNGWCAEMSNSHNLINY